MQHDVAHEHAIGPSQQLGRLAVEGMGAGPADIREVEVHGGLEHLRFVIDPVKFDGRVLPRDARQEPTATRADVDQVPAALKAVLDHEIMVPLKGEIDLE
jgi:hypothetical protein